MQKKIIGSIYEFTIERDNYTHYHQQLFVKKHQDPLVIAKLFEKIRLGKGYTVLLETIRFIEYVYEDDNTYQGGY